MCVYIYIYISIYISIYTCIYIIVALALQVEHLFDNHEPQEAERGLPNNNNCWLNENSAIVVNTLVP